MIENLKADIKLKKIVRSYVFNNTAYYLNKEFSNIFQKEGNKTDIVRELFQSLYIYIYIQSYTKERKQKDYMKTIIKYLNNKLSYCFYI